MQEYLSQVEHSATRVKDKDLAFHTRVKEFKYILAKWNKLPISSLKNETVNYYFFLIFESLFNFLHNFNYTMY